MYARNRFRPPLICPQIEDTTCPHENFTHTRLYHRPRPTPLDLGQATGRNDLSNDSLELSLISFEYENLSNVVSQ